MWGITFWATLVQINPFIPSTQNKYMYYLVNEDHNSMTANYQKCIWNILRSAAYPIAMDGSDDDVLWNGTEEGGNVRRDCEEEEGTDCEDEDNYTDW